jgi:hypothetical protein
MFGPLKKKSLKNKITPKKRHCRILSVPAPAERESKFFWAAIHTLFQRWKIPW